MVLILVDGVLVSIWSKTKRLVVEILRTVPFLVPLLDTIWPHVRGCDGWEGMESKFISEEGAL